MLLNKNKVLNDFLDKLEIMINAGLNLTDALSVLAKSRNKSVSNLSKKCLTYTRKGLTLSDGLKEYMSDVEYSLFKASEKSGNIVEGIKAVRKIKQIKSTAIKQIISGLAYPSFLFAFFMGMVYFLGNKVFSAVSGIVSEQQLKTTILYVYYVLSKPVNMAILIISVVGFFVMIGLITFKFVSPARKVLDRYPPFSVYRFFQGVVFLYALAYLMKSGYTLTQALQEIGRTSKYFSIIVPELKRRIESSDNLGEAMIKTGWHIPSLDTADLLSVISSYTGFEEKMLSTAESLTQKAIDSLSGLSKIIQTVAIVLIGLGVLGYLAGMQQVLSMATQNLTR